MYKILPIWFVNLMDSILKEKESEKIHWMDLDSEKELIHNAYKQLEKIKELCEVSEKDHKLKDYGLIARKCAHLANYAMMIATWNCLDK